MKKIIMPVVVFLVLALFVYYTGLYTYFVKNRVAEEIPKVKTATLQPNASSETSPVATQASTQIKTLKQGNFVDVDFIHKGMGQAKILQYPDGSKILRFENFETVNGPDLYVYLSESSSPTGDLDSLGSYIDLGRLKGNIGNQNYDLPSNTNTNDYNSAIIWCKKFGVLFPYAILK